MFTAEWITAARALETGIATAVVPDGSLLEHARAKAREIEQWATNALQDFILKHRSNRFVADPHRHDNERRHHGRLLRVRKR